MVYDWNDVRYFLAVGRSGSTLAAARETRVSQPTVARRVAALEHALGVELFERRPAGYLLTECGQALFDAAKAVEAAATAFGDAAMSAARDAAGVVRLTTQEHLAVTLLPPILRDLHNAYPRIRIELDTSNEPRDLAAGAADIALRTSKQPKGGGLVGRRIADEVWSVYCSREYAAAHGVPRTPDELRNHTILGEGGEIVWAAFGKWLKRHGLEDRVAMHHASAVALMAAVRAGSGLAVLPSLIADNDPDLVLCFPSSPRDPPGLWLLTHERHRHTPRVRLVLDFLAERLRRAAHPERRGRSGSYIGSPS